MAKKNIFKNYVVLKKVSFSMKLNEKDVSYEFRLISIDTGKRELYEDFYAYLDDFLSDENDLIGANIYLLTKFLLLYNNPYTTSAKPVFRYKRDKRKFEIKTLNSFNYLTFYENKKFTSNDDLQARLKKLYDSKLKTDRRKLSSELMTEAIYYNSELIKTENSPAYREFCKKIKMEFIDFEFDPKDPKEYYKWFKEKFYVYEESEETLEFITKFLYECEGVYDFVWESFFKDLYSQLEKETTITSHEKTIYEFMYYRNEHFGYHIPMFEHVLTQFWNHIESRWRQAAIWSMIESDYVTERTKIISFLKYELENFLKFFPVWLAIVRQDEDHRKYTPLLLNADKRYKEKIRKSKKKDKDDVDEKEKKKDADDIYKQEKEDEYIKTVYLDDHVGDPDQNLRLIDVLPAPNDDKEIDVYKLKRCINELPIQEKEIIEDHYFNNLSQKDIGVKFGISQSAINQRLKKILMLLREKLNSD